VELFVIGATGYIGSRVCERLQADGHVLTGLARSEESAAQLRAAGIEPVRGALGDVGVIAEQAKAADGVVQMDVAKAVSAAAGLGGDVELVDYHTMRKLNGRPSELDFWLNCRASSDKARNELGWQPNRPGVLAELASLPKPLDLQTVYPEPKRQAAAALVKF
jgi:nucleoside-diphosphate-sugar epimerase